MDNKSLDIDRLLLSLSYFPDRPEIVAAILKQPDFNATEQLQRAAQTGIADVAKILVQAPGIDINATRVHRMSPLAKSCWMDHTDFSLVMIEAKADVNLQDPESFTALMARIKTQHCFSPLRRMNVIDALLAAKADVNIQDKYGNTALSFARERGLEDCVEKLLSVGAKELA